MRRSLLLVRSNLRKAKGQTAAIFILILLAGMMLNLWLMLSLDYRQNFERCHDRLNAEHVTMVVDKNSSEVRKFLTDTLESRAETTDFSLDDAMYTIGSFASKGGEINSEFVILQKTAAVSRSVGRVEILEDSDLKSGVYLPILYKSKDIAIGKTVEISMGIHKVPYTVCGFFNSAMAGSHNCGMLAIVLTQDKYNDLEKAGYAPESTLCSVRLKDKSESENYEAALKNELAQKYPDLHTVSNSYTLVAQSRFISQMVCSGIISAMAFFVLLISLVVILSNIANYISENMKNLGALKAIGYTSTQLVGSLLLQFLSVSLVGSLAGAGLSYGLFPFVNDMMISQTGIPYQVRFLPLPLITTLAILSGAVALVVWLSALKIRKVEPIAALRRGMQTHSFQRNPIPLESTKTPLHFALALKTAFSGILYNVTLCVTIFFLSLVIVFSALMSENVISDPGPFVNLIVGETADSCINIKEGSKDDFLKEMKRDSRVEKIYLYSSAEVSHVGGIALYATVTDDFSDINNQNVVFEGRFPKYDNEIVIAAKYAREKNLKIGDEIPITAEGKEAKYIISGFTQTSNMLGKDCLLTRPGYERLGKLQNLSYYMNLTDGTDVDAFNSEMKDRFGARINKTINIESMLHTTSSVYISLMTTIVIAVLVLSAIVISFVLYLLVRTILNKKKREFGILKALGFTTGQLILQTALSFMPAIIVSTAVGLFTSSLIINPLTALFLSGIGIVKCTFIVPSGFILLSGTGLILFAFAITCLLSLKIKKVSPIALFAAE